jgi:Ca2+-binding RTX toxin-like protein
MDGGAGNDRLYGGSGGDSMTDGSGSDVFQFNRASDSVYGLRDVVTDFNRGSDKIDLRAIDGDSSEALDWIGTAGFGEAGQVRWATVGGIKVVQANLDADSAAEFEVAVYGASSFGEGDFML